MLVLEVVCQLPYLAVVAIARYLPLATEAAAGFVVVVAAAVVFAGLGVALAGPDCPAVAYSHCRLHLCRKIVYWELDESCLHYYLLCR
ncbi:hypothetical protein FACS1894181_09830 [Bacteroidia bacterium]|nr:hypothetical protein FACS1894181_09830 [Bacteroidia bacterium]